MMKTLDDKPLLHAVMGACRDIILQAFPCLGEGLIRELLYAPRLSESTHDGNFR
jgi:hypothetical protein